MYNMKIPFFTPLHPIVFVRFVEFGTIREAEQALQKLNGFDTGNNVRLCVKVAERQEDRQKRLGKKREDEAFLSTLYCGKREGNNHSCVEDYEMDDEEAETRKNPFHPQYTSPHQSDTTSHSPADDEPQKVNTSPGSSSERKQLCIVCQKMTAVRCSHCKAPYCSRKCQTEDWPLHKQTCRRSGGSQLTIAENSETCRRSGGSQLMIAENSEDEGFDISIPGDDEIAAIKECVEQMRSGTGSGRQVNSGEKKGASLSTQHPTEKCDGPPSNLDEGIMVPFSEVMSHFTSSSNRLVSIPLVSPLPKEFDAVVTAVLSCTKFSLVALSHETKQALTQLQAFGEQRPGSSLHVDPDELTIGSKCGFWTESGEFYRVEVMQLQSDFVSVRRLDLGGHMTLPTKSLWRLPEELVLMPSIRHRCSLLNVFSENGVGVELFVRLVAGKPVHVEHHGKMNMKSNPKESFSLCKIQSMCRQVDIYEVVRRSQFVERKQVSCAKSPRRPEGIVEEKLTEMAQKSHHCGSEHPASTEGQYRIVHLAHKIPIHQPPNEGVFEIIPTIVTSPAVIWAHVAHPHLGNLTRMEKDLNLHYRCVKDESYAPTTGEICVAKFSEDQQFYRAEVLCVNNNGTVEVLFIDFGNRATVTTGQLRYLEPIFLTLPKQAVQFSLAGITPSGTAQHWSDNAVAYLKGKITRNRVRVEIVSATQTAFLVKMFDPECPKKVLNDAMVALGHAQFGQGKSPSTQLSSLRGVSLGQRRSSGSSPKDTQVRSGFGDLKQTSPRGTVTTSFRNSPHADETFVFGQTAASLVESESQPLTPPTSPPPTEIISPSPKWSALLNKRSPISPESQTTQMTTATSQASTPRQAKGSPGKRPPWGNMKRQSSGKPEEEKENPPARTPDVARQQPMKQPGGSRRESGREKSPAQVSVTGLGPDQASSQKRRDSGGRRGTQQRCPFSGNFKGRTLTDQPRAMKLKQCRVPTESDYFEILVTEVENPHSLFVQVATMAFAQELEELVGGLNTHFQSTPPSSLPCPPEVGSLCCAKFYQDGAWYRAEVMKVSETGCNVRFIDFGNTESVKLCDLAPCPADFQTTPIMAIHCALNGVAPLSPGSVWSPAASSFLKQYSDKVLQARVSNSSKDIPEIELMDTSSSVDLNIAEELITRGLAVNSSLTERQVAAVTQPSQTTPQLSQTTPQLNSTTGLPEGTLCKVQVTDVTDPWSFCVQEMDREKLAALNTLMLELQEAYRNPFQYGGFQVQVGTACCARYDADECWYRCQVLENVGGNRVKLRYVDFGNVECISVNEVYSLDSKFTQLPSAGVLCSLNAVKPVSQTGWSSEAVQVFKGLVMGGSGDIKIIAARVVSKSTSGITKIDLFTDDGGQHSVADILVMSQLASAAVETPDAASLVSHPPPAPVPSTSLSVQDELTKVGLIPQVQDLGPASLTPSCLPSTDSSVVIVTEIHDPSDFWIQVGDLTTLRELERVSQKMNDYCESSPPSSELPELGQLCCAKFSEDGMWYRARVVEFLTQTSFRVHFVDYGNEEVVSVANVRAFKRDFMHVPAQAIHCCLIGFERSPGSAAARFKEMVENRHLIAIHRGESGVKTVVELVDTSGDTDVYIHRQLKGGH